MTRRLAAAGLSLALVIPTAAACTGSGTDQDASSTTTATAAANATTAAVTSSTPGNASSAPNCTPLYPDEDNTGVTLSGGTVTGSMTLSCNQDPAQGAYFGVSIALFYRPNTAVSTTYLAGPDHDTYQDTYTVTAKCRRGLWYIGEAVNGKPFHGTVVDITDCAQTIS